MIYIVSVFFGVSVVLGLIDTLRRDPAAPRQFLGVLGMTVGLLGVISLPWFFLTPEMMDAHPGLLIGGVLLVILLGVTAITIVANRWRRRTRPQNSGGPRRAAPRGPAPS